MITILVDREASLTSLHTAKIIYVKVCFRLRDEDDRIRIAVGRVGSGVCR